MIEMCNCFPASLDFLSRQPATPASPSCKTPNLAGSVGIRQQFITNLPRSWKSAHGHHWRKLVKYAEQICFAAPPAARQSALGGAVLCRAAPLSIEFHKGDRR